MNVRTMKQLIFIILILIILITIFAAIMVAPFIMQNFIWFIVLIIVLIVLWRADFLILLKDYERAVIFRFGKVTRVGGPGWALMIPIIESYVYVDLRTQIIDVPKQDVITADGIELRIDAIIYIAVDRHPQSVVNSVVEVKDYKEASKLFVVSLIRDICGGMSLMEVISSIDKLNTQLKEGLTEISKEWGIRIDAVEIKDVDIPRTVLDAMHMQKAAVQEKLARIERALGHKGEIEAIKEAAKDLDEKALSYYYIRALEKMADGQATKIIFPAEVSRLADAISLKVGGGFASKGFDLKQLEGYRDIIKKFLKEPKKKKKK